MAYRRGASGIARLDQIQAWLDANCGADGSPMAPAGFRGPLNDAIAIYFNDATLAAAFVARWCAGYRVENAKGSSGSGRGSADAAHFGWLP